MTTRYIEIRSNSHEWEPAAAEEHYRNTFYDPKFRDHVRKVGPLLYQSVSDDRMIGYSPESETRLQEAY